MKIKEVADLVGISVRTLRYYDEIGLLTPGKITETGYRIYTEDNLHTLQQILIFKKMGFRLSTIKEILTNPSFNYVEALTLQAKMLRQEKEKLEEMLKTVEKTIKNLKGEINMSAKEKFSGFDFNHNEYEEEARKLWGNKSVDDAKQKIEAMSEVDKEQFKAEFNSILQSLATIRHLDPASIVAQAKIKEYYELLNRIGNYSPETFKNLGQMYVDDIRFTKNIDKFGTGLSKFMCEAMRIFLKSILINFVLCYDN